MEKEQDGRKVKYDDWIGGADSNGSISEREDENIHNAFAHDKFSRGGKKSHLLLQL